MPDHRDAMAGRDRETDIEQDLAFRFVMETYTSELNGRRLRRQVGRARLVVDLPVFAQQTEHLVHVEQRLLDLAVHHAEEIGRAVELDEQGVDEDQVAKR